MTINPRRYSRAWLALALGALLLTQFGGLFGSLFTQTLVPVAYAQNNTTQDITDEEIINYARTVAAIELRREVAYAAASDILVSADSDLSILELPLSCTATRVSDMPNLSRSGRVELLTVLEAFCSEARQFVQANNLTPKRFNTMTNAHREDPALAARIQAAISEI